ncbi:MAG: hypothetical protein RLZZ326_3186 [Planctomycetota bacterium]
MNPHFVEMLKALGDEGVEHLVIGAHALAAHGYVRATLDIDIWVRPSAENAARVWRALERFRGPLAKMRPEDFAEPEHRAHVAWAKVQISCSKARSLWTAMHASPACGQDGSMGKGLRRTWSFLTVTKWPTTCGSMLDQMRLKVSQSCGPAPRRRR